MKLSKNLFVCVAVLLSVMASVVPNADVMAQTPAAKAPPPTYIAQNLPGALPAPVVAAKAWMSVDVTSGQIIGGEKIDERVEPASLTKIMTAYVVFQALSEKRIKLDQMVAVSEHAWRTPGSRMFIDPKVPVQVEMLIRGMIIQSGNDASVALAEAVAGSEPAFVELMNKQAQRLGLTGTHFVNATGLPDPQHYSTVRDLATLAQHLMHEFPKDYAYYREKTFTYNKITQPNRNRLLFLDPSVDGFKTGHTDSAGFCLVASAIRDGRRVLTVLVGTVSDAARAQESLKVLNWSFQNFDSIKLFDANQTVIQVDVFKGAASTAKLGSDSAIWVTVPRGQAANVKSVIERTTPLVAPLSNGQVVGTLRFTLGDKVVREQPLQVMGGVSSAGIFGRALDTVRLWFK